MRELFDEIFFCFTKRWFLITLAECGIFITILYYLCYVLLLVLLVPFSPFIFLHYWSKDFAERRLSSGSSPVEINNENGV